VNEEVSARTTFQYTADALLGGVFPSPAVSAATCQATVGTGLLSIGALDTTVTVDHSYEFDRARTLGGSTSVRGKRPKTTVRVVGDATDLRVCARLSFASFLNTHNSCCTENHVQRSCVTGVPLNMSGR
jgi:hypothetical protein